MGQMIEAHRSACTSRAMKRIRTALPAAHDEAQRADAGQDVEAVVIGDHTQSVACVVKRGDERGLEGCLVAAWRHSASVMRTGHEQPTCDCEHAAETLRSVR